MAKTAKADVPAMYTLKACHYCLNTLQNKQNFEHIVINLQRIDVKQGISVYVDYKVCFTLSYVMLCGQ